MTTLSPPLSPTQALTKRDELVELGYTIIPNVMPQPLLAWHDVFTFPNPPSWWSGDVPDVVRNADPNAVYERSRTPSHYIQ